MITITKKSWHEILSEYCVEIKNNELLNEISSIYENINEYKRYAYVVDIGFGDFIIEDGEINYGIFNSGNNNEFKKDISYSIDPLALVVKNQIEVFTINRCNRRKRYVKEYKSKEQNWIAEKEYIVPLNIINKGDFYGLFGTLDYFEGIVQSNHGMRWYASAGLMSFHFDFPFFHSKVNLYAIDLFKEYFRQHKDYQLYGQYYPGREQVDFVKSLLPDYKTSVVYFPKHIFDVDNKQLIEKFQLQLYKKGWVQSSPIRNNSFENKVLSDIVKHRPLSNDEQFILHLYNYLNNVIDNKAFVLRPLMRMENHFLNDALEIFEKKCEPYFDSQKSHKPIIYIYDFLNNTEYGILSMYDLPILKEYQYEKFNDVLNDLEKVGNEFKRKGLMNYSFENKIIYGFGKLDNNNSNSSSTLVKPLEEFRVLISEAIKCKSQRLSKDYSRLGDVLVIKNS